LKREISDKDVSRFLSLAVNNWRVELINNVLLTSHQI